MDHKDYHIAEKAHHPCCISRWPDGQGTCNCVQLDAFTGSGAKSTDGRKPWGEAMADAGQIIPGKRFAIKDGVVQVACMAQGVVYFHWSVYMAGLAPSQHPTELGLSVFCQDIGPALGEDYGSNWQPGYKGPDRRKVGMWPLDFADRRRPVIAGGEGDMRVPGGAQSAVNMVLGGVVHGVINEPLKPFDHKAKPLHEALGLGDGGGDGGDGGGGGGAPAARQINQASMSEVEIKALAAEQAKALPPLTIIDVQGHIGSTLVLVELSRLPTEQEGRELRAYIEAWATPLSLSGAVPMLLYCPDCGVRHIDAGDFVTKPHHTHACQSCGAVWRPAIINTVGVQFLPGFKDEAPS